MNHIFIACIHSISASMDGFFGEINEGKGHSCHSQVYGNLATMAEVNQD